MPAACAELMAHLAAVGDALGASLGHDAARFCVSLSNDSPLSILSVVGHAAGIVHLVEQSWGTAEGRHPQNGGHASGVISLVRVYVGMRHLAAPRLATERGSPSSRGCSAAVAGAHPVPSGCKSSLGLQCGNAAARYSVRRAASHK